MKIIYSGISLISIAAASLIVAIVMETVTGEPAYYLVMKVAAGLFGVGGPIFGWGLARRSRKR